MTECDECQRREALTNLIRASEEAGLYDTPPQAEAKPLSDRLREQCTWVPRCHPGNPVRSYAWFPEEKKPCWPCMAADEIDALKRTNAALQAEADAYPDEMPGLGVDAAGILDDLRQVKKRHDRLILDRKASAAYIAVIEAQAKAIAAVKALCD